MSGIQFYVVVKPLHTVWQVAGLMPSKLLDERLQDSSVVCKRLQAASSPWFVLMLVALVVDFYTLHELYKQLSKIMVFIDLTVRIIVRSKVIWTLAKCSAFVLKDLRLFLEALEYFDEHVLQKRDKGEKKIGVVLTCISALLIIADCVSVFCYLNRHPEHARIPLWILYVVFGLLDSLVSLNVNILLLELWARLCTVNNSIVKTFASSGDQRLSKILLECVQPSFNCCPAKLDRLCQGHAVLNRASELLMRHQGVTMALEVAGAFSAIIYCSYEVLMLLVAPEKARATVISGSVSVSMLWMTSQFLSLVALVLSCSATADEAERTTVLVARAATLRGSAPSWTEMDALLRQVVATPRVAFTAAGFFTIDRTLLVSALCATVTYLVILGEISLS